MELQDAPATYLFKLWPWIEANRIRIAAGAGLLLVAAGAIYVLFLATGTKANRPPAMDLSQLIMSDPRGLTPAQQADSYLKIARKYQNTSAGQRAFLQSAAHAVRGGTICRCPNPVSAIPQSIPRQHLLPVRPRSAWRPAWTPRAKRIWPPAAYQRVINSYSDPVAATYAKYSLAQIDERQGKLDRCFEFVRRCCAVQSQQLPGIAKPGCAPWN